MTQSAVESMRWLDVQRDARSNDYTSASWVPPRRRDVAEWAAFVIAFLVWALYVLPQRGGWHPYVVPVASLALVPSFLVLRPWRQCSAALAAVACAPALGALVVAALSPYGDGGPISLSRWGYFAGLLLVTAAFARTSCRQAAVTAAVLLAGLQQYASGWLAWWGGGGTVDGPMLGTIYSANPFGSLMLGFALASVGIALLAEAPLRRLGWVTAPLCACGVALSAARAAMLLLVLGVAVIAVLAHRAHGLGGLLRTVLLVGVTFGVITASSSSLLFEGEQNALAATASKGASGQTLNSTTSVRIEYWTAAWAEFRDKPLVGGGSGSYMGSSRRHMSPAAERSPFAHNEVLGSLAEGGLPLGAPVLVLFVGATVACSRLLWNGLVRPAAGDAVRQSLAIAAGALLAHGLVDFALSFPAILGLLALLLGVCLARVDVDAVDVPARTRGRAAAALLGLVAVGLGGGYLGISHDRAGVSGLSPVTAAGSPLPGVRDARVILTQARAVAADRTASPALAQRWERDVARMARVDESVEALRLRLLAASGRQDEALQGAHRLAIKSAATSPLLLLPYAELLAAEERQAAGDMLMAQVFVRANEAGRVRAQLLEVLVAARDLAGRMEPGWGCTVHALRRVGGIPAKSPLLEDMDAETDTGSARCATWAATAENLLGDRT